MDPGFVNGSVISKLYGVDPQFRQVYDLLYPDVAKSLAGSDVHIDSAGGPSKKQKRIAQAGLAATGVATVGGLHAIKATIGEHRGVPKKPGRIVPKLAGRLKLTPKTAALVGTAGWLGLHGVELGADGLAARAQTKAIRANSTKPTTPVAKAFSLKPLNPTNVRRVPSLRLKKPTGVGTPIVKAGVVRNVRTAAANAATASANVDRASVDAAQIARKVKRLIPGRRTAALVGAGGIGALGAANYGATYAGSRRGTNAALHPEPAKKDAPVGKSFTVHAEIAKLDADKRQVFGWASVSEIDGQTVIDLQNDVMPMDELEKSAYQYVLTSRVGGDQHDRVAKADTVPRHTSDLIESMVFTDEKIEKMGLPADSPRGWWVGFAVHDEQNWQDIKSGKRTGFSLHGRGRRETIELEDVPA